MNLAASTPRDLLAPGDRPVRNVSAPPAGRMGRSRSHRRRGPLPDLAHELGLGADTQRNSPMVRMLARLVVVQLACIGESREALAVLRTIPPLARRHLLGLPGHLVERHQAELEMAAAR
jgi:hypothetical protein